jgi:hypothetical protein
MAKVSKMDLLTKAAKKKSPVASSDDNNVPAAVEENELDIITNRIKANVEQFERLRDKAKELKKKIADDVLFITQNKKRLLPDRTLQDYIINDLQISKEYFYQIKRSYDFLLEQDKTDLISQADFRIIDDIARVKDKKVQAELLENIDTVSRAQIKEEIKKCDGHTFSNETSGSSVKHSGIVPSFENVAESIVEFPTQIKRSKTKALNILMGSEEEAGIIEKLDFNKKQLQTLRDYVDSLIEGK